MRKNVLSIIPSNVTGIDVAPQNLQAAYAYQETLPPGTMTTPDWREWPWRSTRK
jgi:hypothetical protein